MASSVTVSTAPLSDPTRADSMSPHRAPGRPDAAAVAPAPGPPDTSGATGDYVIDWGSWLRRAADGRRVAALVISVYAAIFVGMLASSPYWSPFSTVDEQVTYYQVARNFNRFGFMPTLFLHDVATASDPALHPFVYNHMPPGPEIAIALLMKLVGEHYGAVRLGLALVFLAGLVVYLRFARIVLQSLGLAGAGFALLFLTPYSMLHSIDHPAYSPFPLLAFLPLVLLDRQYRTTERWPLPAALGVVLVSSVYLVYQNLFMLVAAWVLLHAFRIVRFERRHLIAFLLTAALGLVLHGAQSVLLLGPGLFLEETALALSNRAVGIPSMENLTAFYRAIDVVHHGGHRLDLLGLGATILSTLRIAEPTLTKSWSIGEVTITLALLVAVLLWGVSRLGLWQWGAGTLTIPRAPESVELIDAARRLGRLALWGLAAVAIPLALVPAYSVDYGLSGMGEYFLGIVMVAIYAFAVSQWLRWRPSLPARADRTRWSWSVLRPIGCWAAILVMIVWAAERTVTVWHSRMWTASWQVPDSNPDVDDLVQLGEALRGKVVMTNVYPTTVGFFTEEVALGGCEGPVFGGDGRIDPGRCHLVPVRGFGRGVTVTPTHYVLFHRKHLTGFTRCRDACLDAFRRAVSARYPTVLGTGLYTVFDLTRPRPATSSPGKLS